MCIVVGLMMGFRCAVAGVQAHVVCRPVAQLTAHCLQALLSLCLCIVAISSAPFAESEEKAVITAVSPSDGYVFGDTCWE